MHSPFWDEDRGDESRLVEDILRRRAALHHYLETV